jgi:hypothetical protein
MITSARIKKKAGGKKCLQPADLEAALPEIQEGIAKNAAARMYDILGPLYSF